MPQEAASKYEVIIAKEVRKALGLKVGDRIQARVEKDRTIVIERKLPADFDADLEEDLAAAEADYRAGRVLGPFDTAETVAALLEPSSIRKRSTKPTANKKVARVSKTKTAKRAAHHTAKLPAHARPTHR